MATTSAFTGDGVKFTGNDGYFVTATAGTVITGAGTTPLPVGKYLVTAVATSSTLPPATTGAKLEPGDFLTVDTGISITPATGDNLITLVLTDRGDISSNTMEFSKDSIEVTTFENKIKTYRAGKPDMSGKMSGVFKLGTTDATNGFLRDFIDIKKQNGSTSFDTYAKVASIYLGFFYMNDPTTNGMANVDRVLVIAPFETYGTKLGGTIGDATSFDSDFKFTDLSIGGVAIKPAYYRLATVTTV
jgi:hypothetical protein